MLLGQWVQTNMRCRVSDMASATSVGWMCPYPPLMHCTWPITHDVYGTRLDVVNHQPVNAATNDLSKWECYVHHARRERRMPIARVHSWQ
jgi:hypothetical protein